jgi:PAS domain S-box-containing protein
VTPVTVLRPQRLHTEAGYFSRIVEISTDCIAILDLDERVEFMNAGGLNLLNLERADDRSWVSLWPVGLHAEIRAAFEGAVDGATRTFLAAFPMQGGVDQWWETEISPAYSADHAQPTLVLARSRNVTKELEAKAFLDSVIHYIPSAVFAKDVETGRFRMVNDVAAKLFGYAEADMLDKTDHDLFPKAQADFFRATDLEAVRSGDLTVTEAEEVTNAEGVTRWFRTKKIHISNGDGGDYLLVMAEDITEARAAADLLREALDRAEAANEAKSEFLANVSHEIRTPLNGVLGMVQVMARNPLDALQTERLGVMAQSGRALLTVINNVLDFSKIEAGVVELDIAPFDLEAMVGLAASLYAPLADEEGVELTAAVDPGACGAWLGDEQKILQVLRNLLSNAIKFTDRGTINVLVAPGPEGLVFTVEDTGVGIPADKVTAIFAKFEQANGSASRRHGGTGLGLSISRRLVTLVGGDISVATDRPVGAALSFTLPLERAGLAPGGREPAAPGRAPAIIGLRVLAAEDNATNRVVLKAMLETVGVALTLVENGREAVAAVAREAFDLVLMDIQMPEMDGIEATIEIRRREAAAGARPTRIIALTANAMRHQVETYDRAGMDGLVAKPIEIGRLMEALESALAARPVRAAGAALREA